MPFTDVVSDRRRRGPSETNDDDAGLEPISLADTRLALIWARRIRAELTRRLSGPRDDVRSTGVRRRKIERHPCPADLHAALRSYPLHRVHTGESWVLVEALDGGHPEILVVRDIDSLPKQLQRPRIDDFPPLPKPLRQPVREITHRRRRRVG